MNFGHLIAKQFRKPKGIIGHFMGQIFDKANKEQNDWTVTLLDIKSTDKILEIGFGSGRTIAKISKLANKGFIAGQDISPLMLKKASKLNAAAIKSGLVKLDIGDAASIHYPNGSFNKVFAVYVIYFWPEPKPVLHEIYRILKQDGLVAMYLSTKDTLTKVQFANTGVFRSYEEDELIKLFKDVGFVKIRIETKQFGTGRGMCVLASK